MDGTSPTGTRYGVPARRNEIRERLSTAYAEDMLDQHEFERRVERAEAAQTIEELDAVVADFGPIPTGSTKTDAPSFRDSPQSFQLLGDQTHVLIPGTPQAIRCVTVIGDVKIDVRAFRGSGRTLTVRASGLLGDTVIRVPQGTRIDRRIRTIMGGYRVRRSREPGEIKKFLGRLFGNSQAAPLSPFPADGPPPTLILEGFHLMGDVVIEEDLS